MKIVNEYMAYLRDNPERYWFKRKLYGWGWTPARPQGWAVVGSYLLIVILLAVRLDESVLPSVLVREFIAPVLILTLLLLGISYLKGESPRWQWGPNETDGKE